MRKIIVAFFTLALGIGLVLGDAPLIYGQEEEYTLEEIVVTATKREENLQLVPSAVSVVEGDQLNRMGQTQLQEMLRDMPGIEMRNQGGLGGNYYIRGVGDHAGGIGVETGVAVSTDGVTATVQSLGDRGSQSYDVERIEVTRGPDSTLQGRSATGGTISIITKEPSHIYEATASIQTGNYHYFSTMGTINAPVGEKFAFRAAFNLVRRDGYLSPSGKNDLDNFSSRVKGLYEPNDNLKVILSAELVQYGGKGKGESFTGPIDLSKGWQTPKGMFWDPTMAPSFDKSDRYIYYADISYDFRWASLYLKPTYQHNEYHQARYSMSFDAGSTDFEPDTWNAEFVARDQTQYSYEVRMASPDENKLRWMTGYYQTDFEEWNQMTFGGRGATEMPPTMYYDVDTEVATLRSTTDTAFYVSTNYHFTDTLTLNFGGRYTSVEKTRNGSAAASYYYPMDDGIDNSTEGERVYFATQDQTEKATNTDYKVSIQKDLTPENMVYFLVSTGFKGGGYNNTSKDKSLYAEGYSSFYGPENLISYEIGTKNQFLNNRLRLNGSIFYYDYQDIQVNFQANPYSVESGIDPDYRTRIRANAGTATHFGADVELDYLMSKGNRFKVYISYLNAEFKSVYFEPLKWLEGTVIPQSPKFRITPRYEHTFDLGEDGMLVAEIDGTYVTDALFEIQSSGITDWSIREAYAKANATLTYYTSDNRWSLSAYMRNIFNKLTIDHRSSPRVFSGYSSQAFSAADPRTYGITLSARF